MSYSYRSLVERVQEIFQTTTSLTILNTGLTGTCNHLVTSDKIRIGDPENLTTQVDAYPQVIIHLEGSNEEIAAINMSSGRRTMTANVGLYCLGYIASDSDESDKVAQVLTTNAQTVVRNYFIKNDYWDYPTMSSVEFNKGYIEPGVKDTYQSSGKINVEYKKLFT